MKKFTLLTAAILFALAAGVSRASDDAKPATDALATTPVVTTTIDTTAPVDPAFASLDKDGDGSLLQADIPAGHDLSTDLFAAFDTNKDDRLSSDEYAIYAGGGTDADAMEEDEAEAEEAE